MGSLTTSNLPTYTSIQILGVTCWEEQIPGESYDLLGKSTNVRKVLVGWNDFSTLVGLTLIPLPIQAVKNGQWPAGWAHPRAPWLRLTKIDMVDMVATQNGWTNLTYLASNGTLQPMIAGNYAVCHLTYTTLDYQAYDAGDLQYDFGTEELRLPQYSPSFSYVSNDTTMPSVNTVDPLLCPPIEYGIATLIYTQKNQLFIPANSIIAALDAPVNSQVFPLATGNTNLTVTLPAGTVRFLGLHTSTQLQGLGTNAWTLQYRFGYKSVGWNKAIKPVTADAATAQPNWVNIYRWHSTDQPYKTSDIHTNLLINPS